MSDFDDGFEEVELTPEEIGFDDGFEEVPVGGELGFSDIVQEEDQAETAPIYDEAPGSAETMLQHGTQGMALGFGDELAGGFEAAGRAVGLEGVGGPISEIGIAGEEWSPTLDKEKLLQSYREGRDKQRGRLSETEVANPKTAIASDLVGGLATPGALFKAATKVPAIAKTAANVDKLSKVKKAAVTGAGLGAAESAGRSDADLTQGEFGEFAGDVAIGTGVGGAAGGLVGKVAQKFEGKNLANKAKKLTEEADDEALRVLGAGKKELKSATKSRYGNDPNEAGIQAIKEGLISPLDKPTDVYNKAKTIKKQIGKGYDELIDRFEGKIRLDETMDDAPDFAKRYTEDVRQKVMNSIDENVDITEQQSANLLKQVDNLEPRILEALDSSNPIKELQNLYVKYNKHFFNSAKNKSPAVEAGGIMRQSIKEIQRKLVNQVDEVGQESAAQFKKLDKRYSNIIDLEEIALDATTKGHKIGFGDFMAGATAKLTGIPGVGEVVTGASIASKKILKTDLQDVVGKTNVLKKYKKAQKLQKLSEDPGKVRETISESPSIFSAATTTTGAAALDSQKSKEAPYKMHQRAAKMAERATPEMLTKQAQDLRNEHGEEGEKLASILEKMSEKDKGGRRALMFHILQSPHHRKMLGVSK